MKEDEEEMVLLNIRISKATRKKLKLIAVQENTTITELLMEHINKLTNGK